MRQRSRTRFSSSRNYSSGFSMIEVLVALVVLAFGLLGFALLQTMNLRFTQSANYRTQATILSYDLIDQMRANRLNAWWYSGTSGASFNIGAVTATTCSRPIGSNATIAQNVERWQCQVVRALGETASANVTYNDGVVVVEISWGDQRWDQNEPEQLAAFSMETRL